MCDVVQAEKMANSTVPTGSSARANYRPQQIKSVGARAVAVDRRERERPRGSRSQGLPVWSQHVGDPVLESNITRRVDFALFTVEALENDEHCAPFLINFFISVQL